MAKSKVAKFAKIRESKFYKGLSPSAAVWVIEGCDGEPSAEDQQIASWQYLVDKGIVWQLQGFYGRTATSLIEAGVIEG